MSERFLLNPNLPDYKVTTVFANIDDNALKKAFDDLSIKVIQTTRNNKIDAFVGKHADILMNYVGKSTFLVDENQIELCNFIEKNNGKSININDIESPYPNDCLLNFADVGDFIICNESIMTKNIVDVLPNKQIIDVKQGYSKCSVCICGRNTIITDDISIYNAVSQYGNIKSLLIKKGSVRLSGYDYGFIGGCCGLIDKDLLFFNGDLSFHTDCAKIIDFLYENNVKYICIKGKPLTDIGSVIPILETVGD